MPLERRSLLKVKMGRCNRDGKKIVPDARRGDLELRDVPGKAGVTVEWRERGTSTVELELFVLPGETRVRCINKGVFLLEYIASADRKYFFWTQETEGSDEDCVAKLSKALNPSSLSSSGDDHASTHVLSYVTPTAPTISWGPPPLVPLPTAAAPKPAAAALTPAVAKAAPAAAAKGGAVQIADLQSILSSLSAGTGGGEDREARRAADLQLLVDVLNFESLFPVISTDPAAFEEALRTHFPPELQQSGELYNVLRSPQFRQALESFHSALLSGHMQMSLFRELNLDLNSIGVRPSSESFLRAIRAPPKSDDKPPGKMDTS